MRDRFVRDLAREPGVSPFGAAVVVRRGGEREALLALRGPSGSHARVHSTGGPGWGGALAAARCSIPAVVRRVPVVAVVALLGACPPALLHAQRATVCDRAPREASDEVEVRPADGAERVARNAPIVARFDPRTDLDALQRSVQRDPDESCRGAVICLFAQRVTADSGAQGRRVPVQGKTARLDERSLRFTPDRPLAADTRHFALIARPGFDSASRTELAFTTGDELDREPPELTASAEAFELDVEPPPAECEAPAGSLRVRLEVPAARDDGDAGSVELSLFLTRAAGLRAPELRVRAPNEPDGTVVLAFTLDPGEAADSVCVALEAVDGTGKRAEAEPELCFNPSAARRSQFESLCRVAAPGARPARRATLRVSTDNGRGVLIASSLLAAVLGWRTMRRLRARAPAHRGGAVPDGGTAPAHRGGTITERS